MPRRNNRRAKPQQRRRSDGQPKPVSAPRPPIERLIVPKGRCFFRSRRGKLIFTHEEAQKALSQAQANRARRGSGYSEKRFYRCPEGGCGGWHLTSRENYEERKTS